MEIDFRCSCPITSALDIVGDKWILVIVKQMLLEGSQTFKDFTESDESIASNILSAKLKILEGLGYIQKNKLPTNKKANIYRLTEKGLSLTSLIVELALWSDQNLRELNELEINDEVLHQMKTNRLGFIEGLNNGYRQQTIELFGESN